MKALLWGLRNPVTMNLLMFTLLALGISSAFNIRREMFPSFTSDLIEINVVIEEGSTPDQVDRNVVQLILPRIKQIEGVKEVHSTASKNSARLIAEVLSQYDVQQIKQKIKNEVDTIRDFPEKALDPHIAVVNQFQRAIQLAVYGELQNTDEIQLRNIAEFIKRDLQNQQVASQVEIASPRPLEISIALSPHLLRSKNLTIAQVAEQIRQNSFDANAGEVYAEHHNITLKSSPRKITKKTLEQIPIKFPNGEFLLLKDLTGPDGIQEGFSEDTIIQRFNGYPSTIIKVEKTETDDIIDLCQRVKDYASNVSLPSGIHVYPMQDMSVFVRERLQLILKNAGIGIVLVILVLSLFLEWQTAFWTAVGIAFSLIGALGLLYLLGESINMISLFAFLMTMGIVVDDAIVVGEAYFHKHKQGHSAHDSAWMALQEVAWPVSAMMATTIMAFTPLLFITGILGKFLYVIPVVVILSLILSLLEALFILPAHLAHHSSSRPTPFMKIISYLLWPVIYLSNKYQPSLENLLQHFYTSYLKPLIQKSIYHRYATAILFASFLIFLCGLVFSGYVKTEVFPNVEGDTIIATLEFEQGTSIKKSEESMNQIASALLRVGEDIERSSGVNPIKEYYMEAGTQGSHQSLLLAVLKPVSTGRNISSQDFSDRWRYQAPKISDATSLKFSSARGGPQRSPIEILFSSDIPQDLERAKKDCMLYLSRLEGVVDIHSSDVPGAKTVEFPLKEEFRNQNLSEQDLFATLKQSLQGIKVDTFFKNENEVKIYVKTAPEERQHLFQINNLYLENGLTVGQVANPIIKREAAAIKRVNSLRTVTVKANVDHKSPKNPTEIRAFLKQDFLEGMKDSHASVNWTLSGEAKDSSEALASMIRGYIPALFTIFVILATVFRSYLQPFIIMGAIPFGITGAIIGHFFMNIPLNILSGCGFVGLTGIAVNDSLVLIDSINAYRNQGLSLDEALLKGSERRLRPILLTSLTTIVGMTPILFETSFQAQFLIPMVTSIVFGLAITTFLILILIPVGYAILEDLQKLGEQMKEKILNL